MFSQKTILEIVKALNFQTHDEVERFSIEFDIEDEISGRYRLVIHHFLMRIELNSGMA